MSGQPSKTFRSIAWALTLGLVGCTGQLGSPHDSGVHPVDSGRLADVTARPDVTEEHDASARPDVATMVQTDSGPVTCPTAPPFDANDPRYHDCTRAVYVAAGQRFRRAISYDGRNWEYSIPPDPGDGDFYYNGAAVGNGIVVLVGGRGDSGIGIMTSFDGGATFTVADVPHDAFDLYAGTVTFFHGAFWVVAGHGTWTSTDGMHWTGSVYDTPLPGGVHSQFGGHGGGWAVSDDALVLLTDGVLFRRFDGTNWSQGTIGRTIMGYPTGLAYGAGRFVVTATGIGAPGTNSGYGLRSASTDDGMTWPTVLTNGMGAPEFGGGSVLWQGTYFYAGGGRNAYTSTDGLVWTTTTRNMSLSGPLVLYEGVWVGATPTDLAWSNDGITWTIGYASTAADAMRDFRVMAAGRVLR